MRTPRQGRSSDSAARMLDAALDLAVRHGLHGVTVADVARTAGTSNGSLYHRFGDRTGLLVAAQRHFLSGVEQELRDVLDLLRAEPDDTAAVRGLVTALLERFHAHAGVVRTFLLAARDHPDLCEQGGRTRRAWSALVVDALRERFGCSADAAGSVFRITFSVGMSQVVYDDGPLPEVLTTDLTRGVLAVLRGPDPAADRVS